MLNQLQRGDEPALLPCRRSGFLRRPCLSTLKAWKVPLKLVLRLLSRVGTWLLGARWRLAQSAIASELKPFTVPYSCWT